MKLRECLRAHAFLLHWDVLHPDSDTELKRLAMVICHVQQLHHKGTTELLHLTNQDMAKKQVQRQDIFSDEGSEMRLTLLVC